MPRVARFHKLAPALAAAPVLTLGGVLAGINLERALVAKDRIFDVDDAPASQWGLVLGARVFDWGPSTILRTRLDVAVSAYQAGKVQRFLVSGDGLARSLYETRAMREYMELRGVPSSAIVEDIGGMDTYDSCLRAKLTFGITSMAVISQPFHIRRALVIARRMGIEAIGIRDVEFLRARPKLYARMLVREQPANLKMLWDLTRRRRPLIGFGLEPDRIL